MGGVSIRSPRLPLDLRRRNSAIGILLTFPPALAALAATIVYPIGLTLWLSVHGKDYAMTGAGGFAGLANYARLFSLVGIPCGAEPCAWICSCSLGARSPDRAARGAGAGPRAQGDADLPRYRSVAADGRPRGGRPCLAMDVR